MTPANRLIRGPLWAILVAVVVAAMASFLVFAQSGEAAPAADGSPTPKIVGGEPVPDGKYPFMVFLDIAYGSNLQNPSYCGGTLIDKDSVLTAAHCLYDPKTGQPYGKVGVEAYVGRTVRSSNQGQVRSVKTFYIHPNYDWKLNVYDAAVLELRRPVSGIEPIELATPSQNYLERPGRDATVAGWGNTFANPPDPPGLPTNPDRMLEAQVPIVSDSRADKVLNAVDPKDPADIYFSPLMIAAGGNGKDSCQGDSGGPLFSTLKSDGDGDNGDDNNGDGDNGDDKNRRDTNGGSGGKYTQIGIVSWGFGCAQETPGAYTEVNNPSVRSFITNAASN